MQGLETFELLLVALAGLACGFMNTVASSGSVVSLPILMWASLHATEANATNRVPVLIGSIAATLYLAKNKAILWSLALRMSLSFTDRRPGIPGGAGAARRKLAFCFVTGYSQTIASDDLRDVPILARPVAELTFAWTLRELLLAPE